MHRQMTPILLLCSFLHFVPERKIEDKVGVFPVFLDGDNPIQTLLDLSLNGFQIKTDLTSQQKISLPLVQFSQCFSRHNYATFY